MSNVGAVTIHSPGPVAAIGLGLAGVGLAYLSYRQSTTSTDSALGLTGIITGILGTGLAGAPATSSTGPIAVITGVGQFGQIESQLGGGAVTSILSKFGKAAGVFGLALSSFDLGTRIGNCINSAVMSSATPNVMSVSTPSGLSSSTLSDNSAVASVTNYFGNFLAAQQVAATEMTDAINKVFGNAIKNYLPNIGQDVFVSVRGTSIVFLDSNGNIVQNKDGSGDYIVPISDVIQSIDQTNPDFLIGLAELSTAAQDMANAYAGLNDASNYFSQIESAYASFVTEEAVALPRRGRRPILAYPLRLSTVSASVFAGCQALLVFIDLERRARPPVEALHSAFTLTAAESRLAIRLASGSPIEMVADKARHFERNRAQSAQIRISKNWGASAGRARGLAGIVFNPSG
jgi:hypothetical protein